MRCLFLIACAGVAVANVISPESTDAIIAGGVDNTIIKDGDDSVIAGGRSNKLQGKWAVIGGGAANFGSSNFASILGGYANKAIGRFATTLGGSRNTAGGRWALAAGSGGKAQADRSAVFSFSERDCKVELDNPNSIRMCADTIDLDGGSIGGVLQAATLRVNGQPLADLIGSGTGGSSSSDNGEAITDLQSRVDALEALSGPSPTAEAALDKVNDLIEAITVPDRDRKYDAALFALIQNVVHTLIPEINGTSLSSAIWAARDPSCENIGGKPISNAIISAAGWKLVRRVKQGQTWFAQTDQLLGYQEYQGFEYRRFSARGYCAPGGDDSAGDSSVDACQQRCSLTSWCNFFSVKDTDETVKDCMLYTKCDEQALVGADTYGSWQRLGDRGSLGADPTGDYSFAVPFHMDKFDEMLFATGDGSQWLIANVEEAIGGWYGYSSRKVQCSSTSADPYEALWYLREPNTEDPWISIGDHGEYNILYGENSHTSSTHSKYINLHNGANVYIRDTGKTSPSCSTFGGRGLTYGELNIMGWRLVRHLAPGDTFYEYTDGLTGSQGGYRKLNNPGYCWPKGDDAAGDASPSACQARCDANSWCQFVSYKTDGSSNVDCMLYNAQDCDENALTTNTAYNSFEKDSSNADPAAAISHGVKFITEAYDEMLFTSGGLHHWVYTTAGAAIGGTYGRAQRDIKCSSTSSTSYTAEWLNRLDNVPDPWISLTDHDDLTILYAEGSNAPTDDRIGLLKNDLGGNVWIRSSGIMPTCETFGGRGLTYGEVYTMGFNLVRRVKRGTAWHPATDQLRGTDVYGTFDKDPTGTSTFSVAWDNANVKDFLFTTGDLNYWVLASKEAVVGASGNEFYTDQRDIQCSYLHKEATTAQWLRREPQPEDPWIGALDHGATSPIDGRKTIVYGENGFSSDMLHSLLVKIDNGANVFVRYKV